jgi:hypothetical protein
MNKYRNMLSLALSVTAIAISIIALCRVYPHTSDLRMDYQGVIIGILALLVTVLVGINLYTLVDLGRARKDVDEMKKEMDKKEMEIYIRSEKNLIEFHMAVLLMHISKDNKDYNDAYQIVLSGLSAMIHQSRIGLYKDCEITARSILVEKETISMLKISKQSKEVLLNMMVDIKDVQKIGCYTDLMHALYSVVPVQSYA